jgi:hypothetical protein
MIAIVALGVGVGLLVSFVLGSVYGSHLSAGRRGDPTVRDLHADVVGVKAEIVAVREYLEDLTDVLDAPPALPAAPKAELLGIEGGQW